MTKPRGIRPRNPINSPDLPHEEWRPVKGWEDLYSVSSFGRVRGRTGRIMQPSMQWNGYVGVVFTTNKRFKRYTIHRLVAEAFIPNPRGYETVDHLDGNKTINHFANLEWVPLGENRRRAIQMGLAKKPPRNDTRGMKNPQAKLTDEQVREIIATPRVRGSSKALAARFNVSASNICVIRRGHNWSHLRE